MQRSYKTNFQTFVKNGNVKGNFSDILFVNSSPLIGGATVVINGWTLLPGESLRIGDQTGGIDKTEYKILFVAGGQNRLQVATRTYQE